MKSNNVEVSYILLDAIATNNYQLSSEHSSANKVVDLYELDPIIALAAQMSSLTNQITALTS